MFHRKRKNATIENSACKRNVAEIEKMSRSRQTANWRKETIQNCLNQNHLMKKNQVKEPRRAVKQKFLSLYTK